MHIPAATLLYFYLRVVSIKSKKISRWRFTNSVLCLRPLSMSSTPTLSCSTRPRNPCDARRIRYPSRSTAATWAATPAASSSTARLSRRLIAKRRPRVVLRPVDQNPSAIASRLAPWTLGSPAGPRLIAMAQGERCVRGIRVSAI